MKGNKSAQVGIAAMVSLCDCATANNTVAIIVAGDMAREVSHEYKVTPAAPLLCWICSPACSRASSPTARSSW